MSLPTRHRRMTLVRGTLAVGLLALALVGASLAYFAHVLRVQTRERVESDIVSASYFLSDHAGRLFEVAGLALQRTAAATSDLSWDAIDHDKALRQQVVGFRDALPYVDEIWLTDGEGNQRLTTQSTAGPVQQSRNALPIPPDDALVIGDPTKVARTSRTSVPWRRGLDDWGGKPRGSVSASVQASYFNDYWSRLNLPPGTRITLYRQDDGRILAQSPSPGPGAFFTTMPEEANAGLREREGTFQARTDGTERRMGAYHRVGDLPLAVRVTLPASTVDDFWYERARPYLLFALFAAIGLFLVAVMAIRFVRGEVRDRRLLEEEVRRRTADLDALNRIGRTLTTAETPERVAEQVVAAGIALTGAETGRFVIASGDADGDDDTSLNRLVIPVASRGGGLHGCLVFGHRATRDFDAGHRDLAEGLASQAAVSMDNALLHESANREIEARKRTESQQQLLIRELHHRVKNTLATVQAVMGATARSAGSIDQFQEAFTGRLSSLANTHSLLTEAVWQKAPLRGLIEKEMRPYDAAPGRIVIEGEDVDLPSEMAVPLGMAIHEMATNAAKYGALSKPEGSVAIRWTCEANVLRLSWVETGGPSVTPPKRQGFGSKLIDRVLRQQLQAEVMLRHPETGVCLDIVVPIAQAEPARMPMP